MSLSQKLAKLVRVVTTAPLVAALMVTILYFAFPGSYANLTHYLVTLFCLTVLPLLAYPLSYLIPSIRKKGRDGQRNLAIVFSVIGYFAGFFYSVFFGGATVECVVIGTYLLSGLLIGVCSLFHFKASGHACGESGPIAMLCYWLGPWFFLGYGLLAVVFWSSLKLKRHNVAQLLVGSLIPVIAMFVSIAVFVR